MDGLGQREWSHGCMVTGKSLWLAWQRPQLSNCVTISMDL